MTSINQDEFMRMKEELKVFKDKEDLQRARNAESEMALINEAVECERLEAIFQKEEKDRINIEEFATSCGWNGLCVKTDYTVSKFSLGTHCSDGNWHTGEGLEIQRASNHNFDINNKPMLDDKRAPPVLCCKWAHSNRKICFGDSSKGCDSQRMPAMLCRKGKRPIIPQWQGNSSHIYQTNAPKDTEFYPCPSCYPAYWESAMSLHHKNISVDVETTELACMDLQPVYTHRSIVFPSPRTQIISCDLGKNSMLYLLGIIQKLQKQIDELREHRK